MKSRFYIRSGPFSRTVEAVGPFDAATQAYKIATKERAKLGNYMAITNEVTGYRERYLTVAVALGEPLLSAVEIFSS